MRRRACDFASLPALTVLTPSGLMRALRSRQAGKGNRTVTFLALVQGLFLLLAYFPDNVRM